MEWKQAKIIFYFLFEAMDGNIWKKAGNSNKNGYNVYFDSRRCEAAQNKKQPMYHLKIDDIIFWNQQ